MPQDFPEVDEFTPLGLKVLLTISPVVSPFTRPLAVNPVIVFVVPSNSAVLESPVTVAVALYIFPVNCVG